MKQAIESDLGTSSQTLDVASLVADDAAVERRVVRKLDFNVLALLSVLCKVTRSRLFDRILYLVLTMRIAVLLAFLDRSNIG